jgi:hypothetical protein
MLELALNAYKYNYFIGFLLIFNILNEHSGISRKYLSLKLDLTEFI